MTEDECEVQKVAERKGDLGRFRIHGQCVCQSNSLPYDEAQVQLMPQGVINRRKKR